MINVLVVDDSAFVREFLSGIYREDKEINVVGAVPDPYKAVELINNGVKVDVISLDLEMPKMDGLTFLEKLMSQKPIPVVVCSSIAEQGSDNAIKALELGAIEVITKPKLGLKDFFNEEKTRMQDAIKSAAKSNITNLKRGIKRNTDFRETAKQIIKEPLLARTTNKVIAIGASTGGTITIRDILTKLLRTCTGIVITQHMPEGFTKSFSNSLNNECQIDVKECENDDKISMGSAIVARGNRHMVVDRYGAYYRCSLTDTPHVNRHRPSVDVMFESIAKTAGKNALGILLTGMGKDGARGLAAIKEAGGETIAQNEESSVVYGMPKAAVEIGAAQHVLGVEEIIQKIIEFHD